VTKQLLPPEVHIRVEVDIDDDEATFTYINTDGMKCNGNVDVTEKNTAVCYVLTNNTEGLIFASPIVDEVKCPEDIIFVISPDRQTLIANDADLENQIVSFKLVVVKESDQTKPYISSDPVIRNVPN
jgi:hypothetical protein